MTMQEHREKDLLTSNGELEILEILLGMQGLSPSDIARDHLLHQSASQEELLELTMVAKEISHF